jgi:hypothetical protein
VAPEIPVVGPTHILVALMTCVAPIAKKLTTLNDCPIEIIALLG